MKAMMRLIFALLWLLARRTDSVDNTKECIGIPYPKANAACSWAICPEGETCALRCDSETNEYSNGGACESLGVRGYWVDVVCRGWNACRNAGSVGSGNGIACPDGQVCNLSCQGPQACKYLKLSGTWDIDCADWDYDSFGDPTEQCSYLKERLDKYGPMVWRPVGGVLKCKGMRACHAVRPTCPDGETCVAQCMGRQACMDAEFSGNWRVECSALKEGKNSFNHSDYQVCLRTKINNQFCCTDSNGVCTGETAGNTFMPEGSDTNEECLEHWPCNSVTSHMDIEAFKTGEARSWSEVEGACDANDIAKATCEQNEGVDLCVTMMCGPCKEEGYVPLGSCGCGRGTDEPGAVVELEMPTCYENTHVYRTVAFKDRAHKDSICGDFTTTTQVGKGDYGEIREPGQSATCHFEDAVEWVYNGTDERWERCDSDNISFGFSWRGLPEEPTVYKGPKANYNNYYRPTQTIKCPGALTDSECRYQERGCPTGQRCELQCLGNIKVEAEGQACSNLEWKSTGKYSGDLIRVTCRGWAACNSARGFKCAANRECTLRCEGKSACNGTELSGVWNVNILTTGYYGGPGMDHVARGLTIRGSISSTNNWRPAFSNNPSGDALACTRYSCSSIKPTCPAGETCVAECIAYESCRYSDFLGDWIVKCGGWKACQQIAINGVKCCTSDHFGVCTNQTATDPCEEPVTRPKTHMKECLGNDGADNCQGSTQTCPDGETCTMRCDSESMESFKHFSRKGKKGACEKSTLSGEFVNIECRGTRACYYVKGTHGQNLLQGHTFITCPAGRVCNLKCEGDYACHAIRLSGTWDVDTSPDSNYRSQNSILVNWVETGKLSSRNLYSTSSYQLTWRPVDGVLNCQGNKSCVKSTPSCPPGKTCVAKCGGKFSCNSALFSGNWSVECGYKACLFAQINGESCCMESVNPHKAIGLVCTNQTAGSCGRTNQRLDFREHPDVISGGGGVLSAARRSDGDVDLGLGSDSYDLGLFGDDDLDDLEELEALEQEALELELEWEKMQESLAALQLDGGKNIPEYGCADSSCTCKYVGVNTNVSAQFLCQKDTVCYNLVAGWCAEEESVCEIPE